MHGVAISITEHLESYEGSRRSFLQDNEWVNIIHILVSLNDIIS